MSIPAGWRAELESLGDDLSGVTLHGLLMHARACHEHQEEILTSKDVSLIAQARSLLTRCDVLTESSGIFSRNETAEDLATADMRFLLAPFYRAEFLGSLPAGSSSDRESAVHSAAGCYSRFLTRLQQYSLLGELGSRLYAAEQDAAENGEGEASGSSALSVSKNSGGVRMHAESMMLALGSSSADAQTRRQAKIDRFKRQKELNMALAALTNANSKRAIDLEQDDRDQFAQLGGGGDEEAFRTLIMLQLELSALRALDSQASLAQEQQLLRHAASYQRGGPPGADSGGSSSSAGFRQAASGGQQQLQERAEQRQEMMTALRSVITDLDGSKKSAVKQQVFRPSHTMPTMTIEEFADIECAEAMAREAAQNKSEAAQRKAAAELGSDDEGEVMKQRLKDDWQDANPRGTGNSKLRPCG